MDPTQEIELKLRLVEAGDYDLLVNDPLWSGQFQTEQVRVNQYSTTYYDTPDQLLYQNGFSYRIRKNPTGYTATVKEQGSQRGGLFVRGEWNLKVDSEAAAIEPFRHLPVGELLAEITGSQALMPLFQTDFSRTAIDLRTAAGSLIELAADRGVISAPGGQAPICEVELELKDGEPVELLQVGSVLAAAYRLQVEERSKYERGLELLGLPARESSPPARLERKVSIAAALRSQGIFYIEEIFAKIAEFLADPADPETIHQIRVKTRHLRSWLSFFKPVIIPERYAAMTAVLKELTGRMGYIREIDVLQQGWQYLLKANPDLLASDSQLQQRLAAEREREQASVYGQLAAGAATAGLLQIWAWLLEGCCDQDGEAGRPLAPFVKQRLRQWRKRLEKGMARTEFNDRQSLHALRIQAKKLRYAIQSLEPVLRKKDQQRLPLFKAMQEKLGIICDAQRNITILRDLNTDRKNAALNYESGLYIGYLLSQAACLAAEASQNGFPELPV